MGMNLEDDINVTLRIWGRYVQLTTAWPATAVEEEKYYTDPIDR